MVKLGLPTAVQRKAIRIGIKIKRSYRVAIVKINHILWQVIMLPIFLISLVKCKSLDGRQIDFNLCPGCVIATWSYFLNKVNEYLKMWIELFEDLKVFIETIITNLTVHHHHHISWKTSTSGDRPSPNYSNFCNCHSVLFQSNLYSNSSYICGWQPYLMNASPSSVTHVWQRADSRAVLLHDVSVVSDTIGEWSQSLANGVCKTVFGWVCVLVYLK